MNQNWNTKPKQNVQVGVDLQLFNVTRGAGEYSNCSIFFVVLRSRVKISLSVSGAKILFRHVSEKNEEGEK